MPPARDDRPSFDADAWRRALSGDRDAFEAAVAPFHEGLLEAAERQVEVYTASGEMSEATLNPTELVGETLVRAFEHRDNFDADLLGFRAWLLGVQHRALARVLRQEHRYADRKAISLDDLAPSSEADDASGGSIYEFRQPFEVVTYGDLIAGSEPIDVEFDPNGHEPLTDREQRALTASGVALDGQTAILLHDELDLTVSEVAQILDVSLHDTAETLNLARASVRQRLGSSALPEDPSDARDSYTGDPVP